MRTCLAAAAVVVGVVVLVEYVCVCVCEREREREREIVDGCACLLVWSRNILSRSLYLKILLAQLTRAYSRFAFLFVIFVTIGRIIDAANFYVLHKTTLTE